MRLDIEQSKSLKVAATEQYHPVLVRRAEQLLEVTSESNYAQPESSINLPFDTNSSVATHRAVSAKVTDKLRYVFLVGIGGSNLGALAVHEALRNRFSLHTYPQLISLDTTNAADMLALRQLVGGQTDPEEYLVFIISKSGGTVETIANAELLFSEVFNGQVATDRIIVVSDEGSPLMNAAEKVSLERLVLPAVVGGRYSVFSPVGLAPLVALGVDIVDLLHGARDIRPYCLNQDIWHNPAALSAALLFVHYQYGHTVHDTFCFSPQLESVGKWYRQLLGESIGKAVNIHDEPVHTGPIPTVSVGSTDLHSVGQLYLGGTPQILTTFVFDAMSPDTAGIPSERVLTGLLPELHGATADSIMSAIRYGTFAAYNEVERPFMSIELSGITPYELGAFMQFKMLEMMYLGTLFAVDPFDQPNVELYKKHTRTKFAR